MNSQKDKNPGLHLGWPPEDPVLKRRWSGLVHHWETLERGRRNRRARLQIPPNIGWIVCPVGEERFRDPEMVEARALLLDRLHHLAANLPNGERSASARLKRPLNSTEGHPIIEVAPIEDRLLSLFEAHEFSCTPDGRTFIVRKQGYHDEGDRAYVTGLSSILEAMTPIVSRHRRRGGRYSLEFGVDDHWLARCANCSRILAWLDAEPLDPLKDEPPKVRFTIPFYQRERPECSPAELAVVMLADMEPCGD